ncbi:hypothetical protein [Arthrobacter sp. Rue61a]|uniref:hypothetical protein n=1 Tax=Arthrobacter sp. Rue61a TaxID=1118963 RepID=UPI00139220B6|nr:hypothetical protein [Arthrobacter sp. Rue61a]
MSTSTARVHASTDPDSSAVKMERPDSVPQERIPVRPPKVWNPVRIAPETD